ncbi:hypothetical protein Btru_054153 [Bulinus truncatus]|nr:hypothetical protein Btru_054153 [Bulinus truncatus]
MSAPTFSVTPVSVLGHWSGGFQGQVCIPITKELDGWKAHIIFSEDVDSLDIWTATASKVSSREYVIENTAYKTQEHVGDKLCFTFIGHGMGDIVPTATVYVEGMDEPVGLSTTPAPTAPTGPTHAPHPVQKNYTDALGKSILFYEAQRSGKLPADNRVPWRGDSALNDCVPGGWYDAGDHVKFGLPMASTTTVLLWSMVKFKDGYVYADQLDNAYEQVKWTLDYFLKGWNPQTKQLVAQVGDGRADHSYWGRPEDMTMPRPCQFINETVNGSDIAAETAAALAVGSIAFKDKGDLVYSTQLLTAAESLYSFAKSHRTYTDMITDWTYTDMITDWTFTDMITDWTYTDMIADWTYADMITDWTYADMITDWKYTDMITDWTYTDMITDWTYTDMIADWTYTDMIHANKNGNGADGRAVGVFKGSATYYSSRDEKDELCMATLWLYRATHNNQYLQDAYDYVEDLWAWALSWDDKKVACQLILYEETKSDRFSKAIVGFMQAWLDGINYTPCGLAWRDMWGANRYAANSAFVALLSAEAGVNPTPYRKWAVEQINYILGDNRHDGGCYSFQIGYGDKYPLQPHHRAASCPDRPANCSFDQLNAPGPSPHVLVGAIVGGPEVRWLGLSTYRLQIVSL